jgi:FKBP-type peptidyl-prolyl cis-trans isomerase FkpA
MADGRWLEFTKMFLRTANCELRTVNCVWKQHPCSKNFFSTLYNKKPLMRSISIFILFFSTITMTGCFKDPETCQPASPQSEEAAILSYAAANGITPQKHSSGLYYQIISQGTGANPTASSTIGITYTGKLMMNNSVFDQQTQEKDWPLNSLIEGWQIGLPLIKEGGSIVLLVPSSMAYGCQSPGAGIPANSILVFNINLLKVQ